MKYKDLVKKVEELERRLDEKEKPTSAGAYNFKVGDRVQFKSWEEMENEFGCYDEGSLKCGFVKSMKHLCGTYATIESISGKMIMLRDFTAKGDLAWGYLTSMIKPAKNEPKQKVKEVKRRAKVGEYVKVVNASGGLFDDYKNGDTLQIVKADKKFYPEGNDFAFYKNERYKYLRTKEYVVLENYENSPKWTFTEDEKVILRNLPEEYKWIARDRDGDLLVYKVKSEKGSICWSRRLTDFEIFCVFNHLFQSIKWEDDTACEFRNFI